jgi:hypothetical protein
VSTRAILLAGSAVILTLSPVWAQDCGCGHCDEVAADPTFVQHEVRWPEKVQQLRPAYLETLEKSKQEIARLAAAQAADAGSAQETPAAENATNQAAGTPEGNPVPPAAKAAAPRVQDKELPLPQGQGL